VQVINLDGILRIEGRQLAVVVANKESSASRSVDGRRKMRFGAFSISQ
jgi:hypothetical protein